MKLQFLHVFLVVCVVPLPPHINIDSFPTYKPLNDMQKDLTVAAYF